ncbi:twin transmembrane helix small protein [Aestuariibius sp. HNIBRBA575]|uniref:twin transmembrane helix small protein n=1 Tax=Aestuariibius sp. HNIBRBA575 TaxID=3233343 RepID=UPI0034A1FF5C
MASDPLFTIALIACAAVVVVLSLGLGSFGKGGEFNKKHANKLMRWRLGLQFLAVVLVVVMVWLRGNGAS